MTRFAIDAPIALRLVREGADAAAAVTTRHRLVGPAVLRSHALSLLYREVRSGALAEKRGRSELEGLAGLKIRLLGDRVSRATAWRIAAQLDADDTIMAEYLAVASLQADALVTDDPRLIDAAAGIVPVATYEDLTA